MNNSGLDGERLKWLTIGSVAGAVMSMACAPAVNHRDATARLTVCFGSALLLAPFLTRMLVAWLKLPPEDTADVAILVGGVVSLCSWWMIFGFVKVLQTRSDGIVEEGLAFLLPKRFGRSIRTPKPKVSKDKDLES